MKRTRINPISKRKAHQIEQEKPIRALLLKRCKGRCEQCGASDNVFGLHPHEKLFRSRGGKLSLWNSIMVCQKCHMELHNISVAED